MIFRRLLMLPVKPATSVTRSWEGIGIRGTACFVGLYRSHWSVRIAVVYLHPSGHDRSPQGALAPGAPSGLSCCHGSAIIKARSPLSLMPDSSVYRSSKTRGQPKTLKTVICLNGRFPRCVKHCMVELRIFSLVELACPY